MRLIDADRALEIVRDQGIAHPNAYHLTNYATLILREAPTIKAEPVRHGRWERTSDGAARCTACKRKMNPSQYGYAFCGLCGAKMDLEEMI